MADDPNTTVEDAEELDRFIAHLRGKPQMSMENIGGLPRWFKSDACLAADYLLMLRAELPNWQVKDVK